MCFEFMLAMPAADDQLIVTSSTSAWKVCISFAQCGHSLSVDVIHFRPSLLPRLWCCGSAECRECDREVDGERESAVISDYTVPANVPSFFFF